MGHEEPTAMERAAAGGAIGVVRSMTPRLVVAYALALALLGGCVGLARVAGSDEQASPRPDLATRAELVRADDDDVWFRGDPSTLEVEAPVLTPAAVVWLRELGAELDLPPDLADRMAATTAADGEQVERTDRVEVTWEHSRDEGFQALLVTDP
ncbi:hypothetical protein PO878_21320 [Iamia majanohamensis]|uniref:Uncharacterized protein n=1 Tax=Iamia majanohamensis TaxID=467976 RepID=A0AAE9Y5Q7_9ACTN|nr:hypothetical protein [Iamia majanohamensis]WCO67035.1 hypothetical protein PO878_21320 [Iamia majanohamensis]